MSKANISITRRLINAFSVFGFAQAVAMLCSVVRTKCIAVWLGATGVGFNSILVNGSNLISSISQLNIRESSVRDVASIDDEDRRALKCAVVRRWALISGLFGALLMILAAPLLSVSAYGGSADYWIYFAWLAPFVFFSAYAAGENALMQAQGKLKALAVSNLTGTVTATVITVIVIYLYGLKAIVVAINAYAICYAATSYIWRVRLPEPTVALSRKTLWSEGRSFLFLGASISISTMLTVLGQYVFAAFLNTTGGEAQLGLFQAGFTLVSSYVGVIFTAMALEYYPRIAAVVNKPGISQIYISYQTAFIIAVLMPIIVVFISLSAWIIRILYSSGFESIMPYVDLAIIGTIFRGVSACFAYRILASGDAKTYLLTEASSVIIALSLNIPAYCLWGLTGLGVSYIVWYVLYTLTTAAACKIRYRLAVSQNFYRLTAIALFAGIACVILKYIVGWWSPLCFILPWILPLSLSVIFRKKFKYGK